MSPTNVKGMRFNKKINGLVIHELKESYENRLCGFEAIKADKICDREVGVHAKEPQEHNSNDFAVRTCNGLMEEVEVCEKQMKFPAIKLVD